MNKPHEGACTCPLCVPALWAAGIKGSGAADLRPLAKCRDCDYTIFDAGRGTQTDMLIFGRCVSCAQNAYREFKWPYCRLISEEPPATQSDSAGERT